MQISRNFLSSIIVSAVVLGLSGVSQAQLIAPTFSTTGALAGNQGWGGSLGTYFTVTGSFLLRDIGVFDSDANGFASGTTLNVAIFTQAGVQVTTTQTFTQGSPGSLGAGSYRFKSLPGGDLTLNTGNYAIVAQGFNDNDKNYNSFGVGSSINVGYFDFQGSNLAFGQSYYGIASTLELPALGGDPADRFGAGVFTVMIPEPGTLALLGLGLAPIALVIRRRRK